MYTADTLQQVPEPELISGIPPGLAILAGKPKAGKSWLALNLAIEQAQNHDVLYLALEDTERRMFSRIEMIPHGKLDRLTISHEKEDIHGWLNQHPTASLVIIDTVQQYEGLNALSSYSHAVRFLNTLHDISQSFPNILILLLHHTVKESKKDPFDEILGGSGVTGSVDTLLVLERDEEEQYRLHTTGRDIELDTLPLHFESGVFTWLDPDSTAITADLEDYPQGLKTAMKWILGACLGWFIWFLKNGGS